MKLTKILKKRPKFYFQLQNTKSLKRSLASLEDFSFEKKIADRALRHTFLVGRDAAIYMFHIVTEGWANLGKDIDWGKFNNTEKSFKLNRLNFLVSLGLAYFVNDNHKYAEKSLYLLKDWWKKNPPDAVSKSPFRGAAWNSLNTAIRTTNLIWLFHFIKDAQGITDNDKLFVMQVLYQQGKYLHYLNSSSKYESGNWQIHELVALAQLGILFPEFKEAELWKKLAYQRLEEQIRLQFFADGVHGEGSLSYHVAVAQLYLDAILIAKINHFRISKKMLNFTEKMVNFVFASLKPDGTLPLINDSHVVDLSTLILCAKQIFPQNNWDGRYISTTKGFLLRYQGKSVKDVKLKRHRSAQGMKGSKLFPEAGFAVMHNKENTQYLFCDANPGWFPHTHAGKLSFDLYSHGKSLVVDAGNCSYDHYDHGSWYKRTVAHNTIQVNGRDQVPFKNIWQWDINFSFQHIVPVSNLKAFFEKYKFPKVEINRWISNDIFDFIEAKHEGYLNLINPLIHTRKVLYIKSKYWMLIDELKSVKENFSFASHYEFLLHFLPGKAKKDNQSKIVTVQNNNIGIAVIPFKKDDIDEVAITKAKIIYNHKPHLAPFLKYVKHNRQTAYFFTLLLPYKGSVPKINIKDLGTDGVVQENGVLGAEIKIDKSLVYFIHQPRCQEFVDVEKKINFCGKILWLESKKGKANSFLAIDSKKAIFLDRTVFRKKRAETFWKKGS